MPKGTTTIYDYADRILNCLKTETATYTCLQQMLSIPPGTMSKVVEQLTKEKLIEKIIVDNTTHYHQVFPSTIQRILNFLSSIDNEKINDAEQLLRQDTTTTSMLLDILLTNLYDNSYDISCHFIKRLVKAKLSNDPLALSHINSHHPPEDEQTSKFTPSKHHVNKSNTVEIEKSSN